ncbi:acyl-CoA dehydrogenase family protein [Okibacterium endophyticum]
MTHSATIPTPDQLVERAAALRTRLRDDQEAAEERGSHSPEMQQSFVDAGFYDILTPTRYGGYGYDLETFFRVGIEVSRGDPGAGWNFILGAGHTFHFASLFSEQAQAELLGADEPFIAPMRQAPASPAERLADGYRVTGTWDYCSGSTYSSHVIVGILAPAQPGGTELTPHLAVVPRAQFEILDDWGGDRTLGMRASGSNSIRIDGAVVPDHHVVPFAYRDPDVEAGAPGTPGYRLHGDPLFLARTLTYFNAELVATQIGAAYAALDEYESLVRSKNTSYPPRGPRIESRDVQRWFGQIQAKTDAAETALLGALREHRRLGEQWRDNGRPLRTLDDVRLRAIILEAAQLATQAIDIAFATAGTASAKKGSRMQKYYRDAAMYRTHIAAQFDVLSATSAAHHFGEPLVF